MRWEKVEKVLMMTFALRVAAIVRRAGVDVKMENIEKELQSSDSYTNSPVCRRYFKVSDPLLLVEPEVIFFLDNRTEGYFLFSFLFSISTLEGNFRMKPKYLCVCIVLRWSTLKGLELFFFK